MNLNMTAICCTCHKYINFRLGMSNRDIQPFSVACPHCSAVINITIGKNQEIELEGIEKAPGNLQEIFNRKTPFIDMHLDFPVYFGPYTPGLTPFIRAIQMLRENAIDEESNEPMQPYQIHCSRINQLNAFAKKSSKIKTIISLYHGPDKILFKKQVEEFIKSKEGESLLPQDINATLYKFISFVFLPLLEHFSIVDFVNKLTGFVLTLSQKHPEPFDLFIDKLHDTSFLRNIQRDTLKLYPEIYGAELPLRPALLLDFIKDYTKDALKKSAFHRRRPKRAASIRHERFGE